MPPFSLLKKRRDFVKLTKHGESVSTSSLVLQAAPQGLTQPASQARIGYTTTKRIGKAHTRNRCRRRLRAAVSLLFGQSALPDFDYVLIARYTTATAKFSTICRDLQYAIKKINQKLISKEQNLASKSDSPSVSAAD